MTTGVWVLSGIIVTLGLLATLNLFFPARSVLRANWRVAYRRGYLAGRHREQRRIEKINKTMLIAADRTHLPREDANPSARVSNIQIHRSNRLP